MSENKTIKIHLFKSSMWTFPIQLCTAIIGYAIHGSVFWSIMDFFFVPFAWIKWAIMHQVNVTIIKSAFSWFLQ
jgi:hypothetical protein